MWIPITLISAFFWAAVNVLDSSLVKNYDKHPMMLMWSQSLFSIPALIIIALTCNIQTDWKTWLMIGGAIAFLGDLLFFYVLDRIDTSISNAAWAILALLLSLGGFLLFQESWTTMQTVGAVLILGGAGFLSFWHRHISLVRTLLLLTALAALYAPTYLLKKAAVDAGQGLLPVFFWLVLSREILATTLPWFSTKGRGRIRSLVSRADIPFYVISGIVIVCFFLGEFLGGAAYQVGPISLVAVVGNIQPFIVILLAWVIARFIPQHAARELLTMHSLQTKVVGFTAVFIGLALLSLS